MLNLASLNQRVNALSSRINAIPAPVVSNLNDTLIAGDDAGGLSIFNLNDLSTITINGSAYPPVVPADDLTSVLTAGNAAGGLSITGLNDVALTTINGSAYPPVVAADNLTAVLAAGNIATGASAAITLNNGGNVSTLTTTDLFFNGVAIRPIRYNFQTLPFSVSGTPNNVIFASPVINAMKLNTIWKVDVALYSSVVAARNLNTYIVADTLNTKVETDNVFGFSGGGFQTALPPNVPVPIGSYISYTDTFVVDAAAVGSCRFYLTGGTSDGSTWAGNCNLSIVLTRLA
jgi:hypothetical protein